MESNAPAHFDFGNDADEAANQVTVPVVADRGRLRVAALDDAAGTHRFGGPLALDIPPKNGRMPPPLHRVLTLDARDPLLELSAEATVLPLIYGFRINACEMSYRVQPDGGIAELAVDGSLHNVATWPYAGYPTEFPPLPVRLLDAGVATPEQVYNLTWQSVISLDPAAGIVVIVPPCERYGVSLWGEMGDAEDVQVIFEIEPDSLRVRAYNQCG